MYIGRLYGWINGVLVCVMGPAGSGKSTLAKRLEVMHPDWIARVPVDFFFVPRPLSQSTAEYLSQPFTYDWNAVDQALATEDPEERSTPDCDFTAFRWRSVHGGLPIRRGPVLALDGMRPHPRCDLVVLLDIDSDTQQQRLIERDRRWGSTVSSREKHLAATFAAGLAELPRDPDLVLPAANSIDHNAAAIVRLLTTNRY